MRGHQALLILACLAVGSLGCGQTRSAFTPAGDGGAAPPGLDTEDPGRARAADAVARLARAEQERATRVCACALHGHPDEATCREASRFHSAKDLDCYEELASGSHEILDMVGCLADVLEDLNACMDAEACDRHAGICEEALASRTTACVPSGTSLPPRCDE